MDKVDALPSFDDMDKLAKICADAKARLEDAKNQLNQEVARCISEAISNEKYWINGKPPAMSYCLSVIAINGNTPEDKQLLTDLRNKITEYTKEYQEARQLLDNMKSRIAVWQTHSANTRKAML